MFSNCFSFLTFEFEPKGRAEFENWKKKFSREKSIVDSKKNKRFGFDSFVDLSETLKYRLDF